MAVEGLHMPRATSITSGRRISASKLSCCAIAARSATGTARPKPATIKRAGMQAVAASMTADPFPRGRIGVANRRYSEAQQNHAVWLGSL